MTYSHSWIDIIYDEFKAFIAAQASLDLPQRERIYILPPQLSGYLDKSREIVGGDESISH